MVYYIVSGVLLMFFWCPCMAINVSVQYNGGLLPDIILLFEPMLFPSGNPFKEGLGAFRFFCKQSCNPGFSCILCLRDPRAWQIMILYSIPLHFSGYPSPYSCMVR